MSVCSKILGRRGSTKRQMQVQAAAPTATLSSATFKGPFAFSCRQRHVAAADSFSSEIRRQIRSMTSRASPSVSSIDDDGMVMSYLSSTGKSMSEARSFPNETSVTATAAPSVFSVCRASRLRLRPGTRALDSSQGVQDLVQDLVQDSPASARTRTRTRRRRNSFDAALRPAVLSAQVFGVLPVRADRRSRLARTGSLLLLIMTLAALAGVRMVKLGIGLTTSASFVFYGCGCIAVYLLCKFATSWDSLADRWVRSRRRLVGSGQTDVRDARIMIVVLLLFSLAEHVLSILSLLIPLLKCAQHNGFSTVYKSYFANKFPQLYEITPYTVWLSLVFFILNLICTFTWNFIDILVIAISFLLARRFKRYTSNLEATRGKDRTVLWWQEARETYNGLTSLTKHVDDHLCSIVLLSFVSNLYFICLQLLYNITAKRDFIASVYFYFSFAWLLTRAALVSMTAASVCEQSKGPIDTLYSVSSKSFCTEVQRFLVQVTTDTVALSGCRFFWVSRSLVLTLAGTVATYEIVLLQFHANKLAVDVSSVECFL